MHLPVRDMARPLRALIFLVHFGCGGSDDGLPREAISGNVTLDGEPLAIGYVTFDPAEGQATQSGGLITVGKFSVPREQGPVPGKYSVSISSGSAEAKLSPAEEKTGMPGHVPTNKARDPIPAKYNTNSTLDAEVKKGGGNDFPFELKTK